MIALLDDPILLTLAIFLSRVVDVSLGTLRTIMVFRNYRYLAALIGFVEILIWVVAAAHVLRNLDEWYLAVAYAGGFAVGNIVGIHLENKLAIGTELVRAVSANPAVALAERLRGEGFDVVEVPGRDSDEPVEVLLVVEKRRRVPHLLRHIGEIDPEAYCTVSDVKESHTALRVKPADRRRAPLIKRK